MPHKAGYAAIIGLPNAGKSTLMNRLIGEKLSITTSKPQTTRRRILGILSGEDYQIVFIDTPGILKPEYLLQERMLDFIEFSIGDADVVVLLVDIDNDPEAKKVLSNSIIERLINQNNKKIICINKIDLSNEYKLNSLHEKLTGAFKDSDIIPLSASEGFNTDTLEKRIVELLPEHPKFFPDDQLSDENERFFISEIIREKIFEYFRDEIPYSTEVRITDYKERADSKDYVCAEIAVERDSQKPILIGKGGEKLKKLGALARSEIEKFLQRNVYLELRVKVRKKWRSDENLLKKFGYDKPDG